MKRLLLLLAFVAFQSHAEQYSDNPMANCMIKATELRFVGGMRGHMTYDEAMRIRPDLAPMIQEMFRGSLSIYTSEQVYDAVSRMCVEKYQQ